jgi:transposase
MEKKSGEERGMRQIRADYKQVFLLPPAIDGWIGPDHPARFIRDFVDSLDLEALGCCVPMAETGRPPYAVDLLLKVWLYGYFNKIRATRKLEKACEENIALIWLTGMNEPDHNTLWRFWRDNKKVFKRVFKESVQVAVKSDLIGMAVHAMDGTKIMAGSSREKFKNRDQLECMLENLDKCIADVMTETERCHQKEDGEYRLPKALQDEFKRKQQIQKALQELRETDKKIVHPGEPEARYMKNRRSLEPSYNAQAVADQKSGMIVAEDVVDQGADNGQLIPMLDRVQENLGATAEETVADAGYFAAVQIAQAEEKGYGVVVAKSSGETTAEKGAKTDPFHFSKFIYDKERDVCVCPRGSLLMFLQKKATGKNDNEIRRYRCREYKECPDRWRCSEAKNGRMIDISVYRGALERHSKKRERPEKKKLLKARKAIVEPVFAWIKRCLGFGRWTVFGLPNVRAQWSLICATINLKKLYHHWVSGRLVLTAP